MRHFVRNYLKMWALQNSQLSHAIFLWCVYFFQDKTRVRKNGNAELKSRAVNEIKNVLAEVLPFLPVQIFIKSGKSDLPEKEERAVLPAQA